MRYQAFNILHLSCYNKYKTGHFEVGGGGGAKYLLVSIQSKLTSVKVWSLVSTMTCTIYGMVFRELEMHSKCCSQNRKCIGFIVSIVGI